MARYRLLIWLVHLLTVCHGFYHQPMFLSPVFDQNGFEITGDRVLEMMVMKSTTLGWGLGFNYTSLGPGPFQTPMIPPYLVLGGGFSSRGPGVPRFSSGGGQEQPEAIRTNNVSIRPNPYGPPPNQSPVSNGPPAFSPFNHRIFKRSVKSRSKRQAPFSSRGNNFLPDVRINVPFGPQPEFSPLNPSNFPGASPGPVGTITGSLSGPRRSCQRQQPMVCNKNSRYRTVDGICNNLANPTWGASMQPFVRMHRRNFYEDGLDVPRMTSFADQYRLLPSPRLVSRLVHEPDRDGHEIPELTNLIQTWGQFLDHDITGTPAHKAPDGRDLRCCDNVYLSEERQIHNDAFNGGPCHPIYIPPLDRHFQYSCMSFARSQAFPRRADCDPGAPKTPREQMNMLTAYIDASQVYGSVLKDNRRIRRYADGLLKVTPENLLPEDVNSTCVKDHPLDYCFLAGEIRVNEHPGLTTIHVIFHRFHNQMALGLRTVNPRWSDEQIFQEARKIMGAILQHISFRHWLPIVLGPDIMRKYGLTVSGDADTTFSPWSYDITANPTVFNGFATAAFRFGHTLIPSSFTVGSEKIRLHTMFNRPKFILQDNQQSISKFCHGLMEDSVQHYDRFLSTDLTDRLFEDKDKISLDLASLNIQRARDHGLPGYNKYREVCGLPPYKDFDELYRDDRDRAEVFRRVYDVTEDIDLFPGGISERPVAGGIVGETFACILGRQFHNLKFGDRYWYESRDPVVAFTEAQLRDIKRFPLSSIFCAVSGLKEVLVNPFFTNGAFLPNPAVLNTGEIITQNRYVSCRLLPSINLRLWSDPRAQ